MNPINHDRTSLIIASKTKLSVLQTDMKNAFFQLLEICWNCLISLIWIDPNLLVFVVSCLRLSICLYTYQAIIIFLLHFKIYWIKKISFLFLFGSCFYLLVHLLITNKYFHQWSFSFSFLLFILSFWNHYVFWYFFYSCFLV